MRINVHGGTAKHGDPSLCLSCRHAVVAHGTKAAERIVRCNRLDASVTFRVTSCSDFVDRSTPSLFHMEDIAWVLRSDTRRNTIGFVRGKDLKWKERFAFEDE